MKKLLIAALICLPLSAQAEAWSLPNKGNGQIVISTADCYFKGKFYKDFKDGYARNGTGETIHGCWYYSDTFVHMVYEDGTSFTYPASSFQKVETF